jgi:hypothetical protein
MPSLAVAPPTRVLYTSLRSRIMFETYTREGIILYRHIPVSKYRDKGGCSQLTVFTKVYVCSKLNR